MKLKYTFVFIIPLLGLINFNVSAPFDPIKVYPIGDSVVAQSIVDYGIEENKVVVKKEQINYSEILAWWKNPESGMCPYFIKHSNNPIWWINFCK